MDKIIIAQPSSWHLNHRSNIKCNHKHIGIFPILFTCYIFFYNFISISGLYNTQTKRITLEKSSTINNLNRNISIDSLKYEYKQNDHYYVKKKCLLKVIVTVSFNVK